MKGPAKVLTEIHDLFTNPKAYIPRHISNHTVLKVYDMLSRMTKVSKSVRERNREINSRALSKQNVFRTGNFIENQSDWGEVQFGGGRHHNMRYSGCEIIAVYNALLDLGKELSVEDMADLITVFEEKGAALKGEFGTAPYAIRDYLTGMGYEVSETDSRDEKVICSLGEKSQTMIATVYNDKNNIMGEIHTVCITKKSGAYVVHNDYTRDKKSTTGYRERDGYVSLWEAIGSIGRDSQSIYVIGVTKPHAAGSKT